jgi:hypothetical protein
MSGTAELWLHDARIHVLQRHCVVSYRGAAEVPIDILQQPFL